MGYGGIRDDSEYIMIVAEVFYDPARRKNGVRPCEGQPFPQSMKIECSRKIRGYPVGTKIKLKVVETDKEGSKPFLYNSYRWEHTIVEGE